jgi:hypothetical protein
VRKMKMARMRERRAGALANCFTWPQAALNRHEFCCQSR